MSNKQTELVTAIANGVDKRLEQRFDALVAQNAKLTATLNSVLARLATVEDLVSSGAGAKRQVRSAGAKAGGSKAGGKKGTEESRVTNALLFFRYIMKKNMDDVRDEFKEHLETVEGDSGVQKQDVVKDEAAYWSAVGKAIWTAVLSDEQKTAFRVQHKAWLEENARKAAEPQLEQDA